MKKSFPLILIFLFVSIKIFSQEILVPYRVGDKYGLSDYNGKLIVQPIYDWIEIGSSYSTKYFGFTKGEKKGIIYNKKELIVASKDYDFNVLENKFIISRYKEKFDDNKVYKSSEERREAKRNLKEIISLYNLAGQPVYKANFAKLSILDTLGKSDKNKKNAKYTLFVSTGFDDKFSVFVFDNDKQLITNWLLKDYEKFSIQNGSSIFMRMDDAEFIARKDWSSNEELITFELANNVIKMNVKIIPKKNKSTGEGTTAEPYGLYRGQREVKGDPTVDVVMNEPRMEPGKSSKINKYSTRFNIVDDKVFFTKIDVYQIARAKEFKLPEGATKPKIEYVYATLPITKDSVVVETSNVLTFELNGKYGLFITDSILIKPIYKKINAINLSVSSPYVTNFLVGLEDNETKKVKYGTIDLSAKTVIPLIYDEMLIDNKYNNAILFSKSIYDANFQVKINGKYGKISPNNKVILEPIYDEIKDNNHNYLIGDDDFEILRIGNKFGLHKKRLNLFVPAIFDKQIGFLIPNYKNKKDFNLLGLVNDDGQIFCYARKDGLKYYQAN